MLNEDLMIIFHHIVTYALNMCFSLHMTFFVVWMDRKQCDMLSVAKSVKLIIMCTEN